MKEGRVRIEVLTTPDCPYKVKTLEMVREVAMEFRDRADIEIEHVLVDSEEKARELSFPGSPTVRINGKDVLEVRTNVIGLGCRLYPAGDRVLPYPPADMIRRKLEEELGDS